MYCQRCGTQIANESSFCNSCGLDVTSIGRPDAPQQESAPDEIEHVREALKEEYEILSELGRGGMAIVFRALEKGLDREVAVKVLPASMGFDAEFVERFQREARTAAKLEHPSIIPIYRVGKSGRVIYFVMKFLRGKSLADLVEPGALDPSELSRLLSETASALGYAHKHGIVHRDIKPDNILLDDSGRAIVTDFGIAKAATGAKLTGTGMAIGTPHYMSPEQARATPLDGRSDIYSLGVCAYQCLTGKVPFDGTDAFSIGYKHITEDPEEPELETDAERDLYAVIKKMMAKEPDDRYQTAEDLCLALDGRGATSIADEVTTPIRLSAARGLVSAVEASASVTPTTPMPSADFQLPEPKSSARKEPEVKEKSRGGTMIAAGLLVIVVGGGGGGYVYYNNFFDRGTNPASSRAIEASGQVGDNGAGIEVQPRVPAGVADSGQQSQGELAVANVDSEAVTVPAEDSVVSAPPPDVEAVATTGVLVLRGMPRSSQVRLDRSDVRGGTHELSPGSHAIEVSATGRVNYASDVNIVVGDTTFLTVAMERIAAPPPVVQAAATCAAPGDGYNVDNICYDVAPQPLTAPLVPLTDAVVGSPAPVVIWVLVAADGAFANVSSTGQPENPAFFGLAVAYAQQMTYNPAKKDGAPVAGWFQLLLAARR
jgi:serine/threonine protein kinase